MLSEEKKLFEDKEKELKQRVRELERRRRPLEGEIAKLETALYSLNQGEAGSNDEQCDILKTQISVYKVDFKRERRDCVKIHEEKEILKKILLSTPDARIIIAGDIIQLNIRDQLSRHNLVQMVKKPTRGDRILDVFLTNKTHLWKPAPTVFKGLLQSDHLAVLVTRQVKVKPTRKIVYARDTREHRKIQTDCRLVECDWSQILAHNDVNDMVNELTDTLRNFRKMLRTGASTSIICYSKSAVQCTFLGYVNPMDIRQLNSIICLTRLSCPYSCMELKSGVQLTRENI